MIKTNDKSRCCGCGTCGIVCPVNCISFIPDALGCLYPSIDRSKCIKCRKCEAVCPLRREFTDLKRGIRAFAAFSSDNKIRFRGSSGGIFESAASWVLENSGSVYACKFDKNFELKCFEANTLDEIIELTKSKYLQSSCVDAFPVMRKKIQEGLPVLFCSTPCQVAAFQGYIGTLSEADNLYLLDFFCHGVPSQWFFDKCRKYIEDKKKIKITGYEFRTKKQRGATPHYLTLKYFKNGKERIRTSPFFMDPFYLGFQKYITMRDSCYQCPYGSGGHCGDITIGDFHEIDKYVNGLNRFDGVSTVLTNTQKGEKLWKKIESGMVSYEMSMERLIEDGQIYAGGTKEPKQRAEFLHDMETLEFTAVADKWLNSKHEWKKAIYYRLPFVIRKTIKGLMRL
jgi:coenzyme F420-reducing hydrogenase beta subunit